MQNLVKQSKNLPKSPGVYFFYDKNGKLIYVGKASNLKNRTGSYFTPLRQSYAGQAGRHDLKTEKLVAKIAKIDYQTTNSVLEALVLEANLIKKHQPYYNIRQKDDKTFTNIYIGKDKFPRVFVARPTDLQTKNLPPSKLHIYGPFISAENARTALHILRKIFKFRDCGKNKFNTQQKHKRPCLFYPLQLCSAPCAEKIEQKNYQKSINKIRLFLGGKNKKLITNLKGEMQQASKNQNYEEAAKLRNEIFALEHVNDSSLIQNEQPTTNNQLPNRIEAYDISNILGKYATGSMVVFTNGEINKNEYKKFKIKTVLGQNDLKMLEEVLSRRMRHREWPIPDLMVIDGGKNQLNTAEKVFSNIPIVAVSKNNHHQPNKMIKNRLAEHINLDQKLIFKIDVEAHRFAISYHRKLRRKSFLR